MIRILLVDDQRMIREGLKILLEPETDFQIVGTADNGISAVKQVEKLSPDIVLMNIEMPGLDGASATKTISKRFPDSKILILSSYDTDEYIAKLLALGAKGYLLKNTTSQDIAAAIRSVYKGYTQIGPGLLEKLLVQTDSGIILSKLKSPSYFNDNDNASLSREKRIYPQSKNAVVSLQSNSRQHKIETDKFRNGLHKIDRNIPNVKKILSSYAKHIWRIWILLLTSMPVIFLILFSLYTRMNNLEKNSIPIQRVGLYGDLHLSGLAQRVVKAFEQDSELANISSVYVAQKGSMVILKGTISDLTLLDRMKNIARNIEGVTKVDTSSIEIRERFKALHHHGMVKVDTDTGRQGDAENVISPN